MQRKVAPPNPGSGTLVFCAGLVAGAPAVVTDTNSKENKENTKVGQKWVAGASEFR